MQTIIGSNFSDLSAALEAKSSPGDVGLCMEKPFNESPLLEDACSLMFLHSAGLPI